MTTDESSKADRAEQDVGTRGDRTSAVAAPPKPGTASRRLRRSMVMACLISVCVVAALNWPYQFVETSRTIVGDLNSATDFDVQRPTLPVMGGWPFRYWIRYDDPHDAPFPIHRFSPLALCYNLCLGGLVSACVMFYLARRERRNPAVAGKLSIADLLVLTLVLATPFGWWQRVRAREKTELSFANELFEAGGSYGSSAWVPGVFQSRFPASLTKKLRRLHEVRIEYPSEEMMVQLVDHRQLSVLRVGGGDYDLGLIQRLVNNPHLEDLRIAGRILEPQTMQWIAAFKRIHTLNLIRTNVSAEALQMLDQLPDLQRLTLIHSDVVLSELGTPGWSRTIRELGLPHPQPGDPASVRLVGWPRLERVQINEFESQLNTTEMTVELADLPSLTGLQLDVFQKFDLTLRNLPKLTTIDALDYQWRSRLPRGGSAPGQIWCGRLDVDGLPQLTRLYFFCPGLKHFRVRNSPQLEFAGIAAFFRTQSASTYAAELHPDAANALICGLGESTGPATIDLDAVPLGGVDLAPLANNKGITKLLMSQSGTEIKQWKSLEPMKWLTRLDIKGCPIDDEGVQWVLRSFPNLEHFAFSSGPSWFANGLQQSIQEGVSQLEIIDRPKLRTLDLGDSSTEYYSTVRVVNSTNLILDLKLGYVNQLEIVNAPSITGIAVSNPIPHDARLEGIRDLHFFAVGGPAVTDEFIAPLVNCPSLSTLTLAYPAVTAHGLKKLNNLSSLSSLNLPGSAVDDSVIAQWAELPQLTNLDLSDTQITGASLKRLLSSGTARRVVLDRTQVSKQDLGILSGIQELNELSLAGIGIDAATLGAILANRSLTRLDLSNSEITAEMLDQIAQQGSSLEYLILRQCESDSEALAAIAARHRKIKFDLTQTDASTQLMTSLLSAGRIVDRDQFEQQAAMQAMINAASQGRVQEFEAEYPAMIDVRPFEQLARDPQQTAIIGQIPSGPVTTAAPGPLAPIGTRFGRWLGGAIFGTQRTATIDPLDDVPGEAQAIELEIAANEVEDRSANEKEGGEPDE